MLLHVPCDCDWKCELNFIWVIWLQTASTVSCNSQSRNTNLVTFLEIISAVTFRGKLEVLGEVSLTFCIKHRNEAPEVVLLLRVTATGQNGLLITFGCQPNQ
jgi:hypothetical protein